MTRIQHIGGGPVEITFMSESGYLGASASHSIPFSFGAAYPGRAVLVELAYTGSVTLNALTIGGVTATQFINQNRANAENLVMAGAAVPTGTSGNVVAQFSGSTGLFIAAAWRMIRHRSLTPYDSEFTIFPFGSGTKSLVIDSLEGGGLWGGASVSAGDYPVFNAGFPVADFEQITAVGAHKAVPTSQSNETISINQGPSGGGTYAGVLGAVSFR